MSNEAATAIVSIPDCLCIDGALKGKNGRRVQRRRQTKIEPESKTTHRDTLKGNDVFHVIESLLMIDFCPVN
jgi:hypothetical protein